VWLVASVLLGAFFLLGQVTEYARLYEENVTIGRNLFTSAFFTLTGFHGLHVTGGLVALSVLAWLALRGTFRRGKHAAVAAVSAYWHFVDAVWVVLLSLIYLQVPWRFF
jgi:heme/copper-type cytochrome/quinol oxidase subunit 3